MQFPIAAFLILVAAIAIFTFGKRRRTTVPSIMLWLGGLFLCSDRYFFYYLIATVILALVFRYIHRRRQRLIGR